MFGAGISRIIQIGVLTTAGALLVCAGCKRAVSERPIGTIVEIKPPLGLPPVPIPPDNPPTTAAIVLGRELFYDTRLSADNTLACSSCHDPAKWFEEGGRRTWMVCGGDFAKRRTEIDYAFHVRKLELIL